MNDRIPPPSGAARYEPAVLAAADALAIAASETLTDDIRFRCSLGRLAAHEDTEADEAIRLAAIRERILGVLPNAVKSRATP